MTFFRSYSAWLLVVAVCGMAGANVCGADERPVGPITLEEAYDRALATDQAIRIAYWEVRKANLLPWSALTRLGPQLTAGGGYSRRELFSKRTVTETITQPSSTTGIPTIAESRSVERTTRSNAGTADIGLSFVQPLIDLSVFPAYRAGKLSKSIARLEHQFTVRGTLFG